MKQTQEVCVPLLLTVRLYRIRISRLVCYIFIHLLYFIIYWTAGSLATATIAVLCCLSLNWK